MKYKELGIGKLPPQAIDMEEAILGAIMLEKSAMQSVLSIISNASVFYKDSHRWIYEAITILSAKKDPIDLLTVTRQLREMGKLEEVGGAFYVTGLTEKITSAANIEAHSRIVLECFFKREVISLCTNQSAAAFDESQDIFAIIDQLQRGLNKFSNILSAKKAYSLSALVPQALDNIMSNMGKDGLTGIPSGIYDLDSYTGGWQNSDLIIIAARPGMGKTSFALNVARNAAIDFNKKVAFFSLEMNSLQLVTKIIASETDKSTSALTKGRVTEEELEYMFKSSNCLITDNFWIDDTPSLPLQQLRAKCHQLKSEYGIELIVVDYLQLMTITEKVNNREQEVARIAEGLKSIAKELNVPVIALSQLNRELDKRPDKRPNLSDLRESGSIEQAADIVLLLYRPEYYGIAEYDNKEPTKDTVEVNIAKHRNGATAVIKIGCKMMYGQFYDLIEDFDRVVPKTSQTYSYPSDDTPPF